MRVCHNRLAGLPLELDQMLQQFWGMPNANPESWAPRAEVLEGESGYRLILEMPGMDVEDVSLEMAEDQLIVAGEKRPTELAEGFRRVRSERVSGQFKRAFEFSKPVDADGIRAEFRQGVLTVDVPKSKAVLPRKIEIASVNA